MTEREKRGRELLKRRCERLLKFLQMDGMPRLLIAMDVFAIFKAGLLAFDQQILDQVNRWMLERIMVNSGFCSACEEEELPADKTHLPVCQKCEAEARKLAESDPEDN